MPLVLLLAVLLLLAPLAARLAARGDGATVAVAVLVAGCMTAGLATFG